MFSKPLRNKQARCKAVSLLMATLMLVGPGITVPSCSIDNKFLGLEDYQRELLFFVGSVAISLLTRGVIGVDPPANQGNDGEDGLNCWDLNGNGDADPAEDRNQDGSFDAFDCQGAPGLACWDLNGNGVADAAEDVNDDGAFDAIDCRTNGSGGSQAALDGISCWDLNANRQAEAIEDKNGDGSFDGNDCQGAPGLPGEDGSDGDDGDDGADGLNCWDTDSDHRADPSEDVNDDGFYTAFDCRGDGAGGAVHCWDLNENFRPDPEEDFNDDGIVSVLDCRGDADGTALMCWDLNGNGVGDPAEDVNSDGFFTAHDCQGADGSDGTDGLSCWDLNGNGVGDPQEDMNEDQVVNALDCQGADGTDGQDGTNGLHCWDLNGNGVGELTEDINLDGFYTAVDCRGPAGPTGDGSGPAGLSCWDLNGNGAGDPLEDVNLDQMFTALDCRGVNGTNGTNGTNGFNCWDLNSNRLNDAAEDVNHDGLFNTLDCRGASGTNGTNGRNCWDLNGNGSGDPIEDKNGDSFFTAQDCVGAAGEDGTDGLNGVHCWDLNGNGIGNAGEDINGDGNFTVLDCRGTNGTNGTSGINCWDRNANRVNDASEDTNQDGQFNGLDCQGTDGQDGTNGTNGRNCWDTNGSGIADPSEDVDGDGFITVMDCRGADGADGEDGQDGLHCWDLNGNGFKDGFEDTNDDNVVDVLDCRGNDGNGTGGGEGMFDIFIDEFFTVGSGSYGTVTIGDGVSPVQIEEPALGQTNVIAYRVSVPEAFNEGGLTQNEITMRLFFWRNGPVEDCFVARLDAFRTSHGQGISPYGGPRYVKFNDPASPDPAGTTVVVDLPLNNATGGTSRGLALPANLDSGEFLAFEWNIVPGSLMDPTVSYILMGVEFFETGPGQGALQHAAVFSGVGSVDCDFIERCESDAECNDGNFCNGIETCDGEGQCQPGEIACGLGEMCDEVDDICKNCTQPIGPGKAAVCHDDASAERPYTVVVHNNGVGAHLAHGDTLGQCQSDCAPCEFVVVLDDVSQGDVCVASLRPVVAADGSPAPLVLTARSGINGATPKEAEAIGSPGAVLITSDGAGVRTASCEGSNGISGTGLHEDEELVITFDSPAFLDEITVRLNLIDFFADQPVFFISNPSTPGYEYVIIESAIQSAFTQTDFQQGMVLFSRFTDLPPNIMVDKLKIRETQSHINVDVIRAVTVGCGE